MITLFKEFRSDGWPYCPRCEEDELYSVYLMTSHGIEREIRGEVIFMTELLKYPFRCYACNWRNDEGEPLAALIAITCAKPAPADGARGGDGA